jgi:hypothetical protein
MKGNDKMALTLEDENKFLRNTLKFIEEWNIPEVEYKGEMVPYHNAWGSNGERDYIRAVARGALKKVE